MGNHKLSVSPGLVFGELTILRRTDNVCNNVAWICHCSGCDGETVEIGHRLWKRSGRIACDKCLNINLIGRRVGSLEVIDKAIGSGKGSVWRCYCHKCSSNVTIKASRLINGKPICDNCTRLSNELTGQIFGNLIVLCSSKRSYKVLSLRFWRCFCKLCRRTVDVSTSRLRMGQETCKKCSNYRGAGDLSAHFWGRVLVHARQRELIVEYSIRQAWDEFVKWGGYCRLSGVKIFLSRNQTSNNSASFDRVDSLSGYILNNGQWVHKTVNQMKWNLPQGLFIELCRKIAYYQSTINTGEARIKGRLTGSKFASFRSNARQRQIAFLITREEAFEKLRQQGGKCALTGDEIGFDGTVPLASLDRIDSTKDYSIDNIQWVRVEVNSMKTNSLQDKFVRWCRVITKYQELMTIASYSIANC